MRPRTAFRRAPLLLEQPALAAPRTQRIAQCRNALVDASLAWRDADVTYDGGPWRDANATSATATTPLDFLVMVDLDYTTPVRSDSN